MSGCKYNHDEFCVNDQCPMCGDYCPVPDIEGVCQHEEREEETWVLAPKGCAEAAMNRAGIRHTAEEFETFWADFEDLMAKFGYVKEGAE